MSLVGYKSRTSLHVTPVLAIDLLVMLVRLVVPLFFVHEWLCSALTLNQIETVHWVILNIKFRV
jgi:hypothetical protein